MDLVRLLRLDDLGLLARQNIDYLSFALAIALTVVLSKPINGAVYRLVRTWPFLVRTAVFVALFTFGWSMMALTTERLLRRFLASQQDLVLVLLVVGAFVGFGIFASRERNFR